MVGVERFYQKGFIIGMALVIILPINIMLRLDDAATEVDQTNILESFEDKTTDIINVNYSFSVPEIKEAEIYDMISIQGLRCHGEPGMPILPSKSAKILLPYGHKLQDIEVKAEEEIELSGKYLVEPGQTPLPLCFTAQTLTPPNQTAYNSLEQFPGKLYSKLSVQTLRGYKFLTLNLYPVQYIPKTGIISYFENMKVTVTTTQAEESPLFRGLLKDEIEVKKIIDNPWTLSTYEVMKTRSLVNPSLSYQYVIITDESLTTAFQPLIDWKRERGINSTLVTIQNITSDPDYWDAESVFNDTQAQIRNFIKDAYLNWETDYVLLGGDDELLPHRGFYVYYPGFLQDYTDKDIPADMYFGCLDGNWNDDKDDKWGEPGEEDYYGEVYIGRATVSNAADTSTFVDKTIFFEQNNNKNVTLHGAYAKKNTGTDCKDIKEDGDGRTNNKGVHDHIPVDYTVTTLYESDMGTIYKDDWENEFKGGRRIINHATHGRVEQYHISYYPTEVTYYDSDAEVLTNDNHPLHLSVACYIGSFDGRKSDRTYVSDRDCLAEEFIISPNGGCAACIMNSRYGWYGGVGDPVKYSGELDIEFYDYAFTLGYNHIGEALQKTKEEFASDAESDKTYRWCVYEFNLLGDPETPLRDLTGPKTSNVQINPNPPNGAETISVTATVNDTTCSGSKIIAAELFIDTIGTNGTGCEMFASDGLFDSRVEDVINDTVDISNLANGTHIVYVHGQDVEGNWGDFSSCEFNTTDDLSVAPPTNTDAELSGANYENVTIAWTLSKDDGGGENDVAGYDIYYNQTYTREDYNKSKTYTKIGDVSAGVSYFVHDNDGLNTTDSFYYVVVKDGSGNTEATVDQAGKIVKECVLGWNFISDPYLGLDGTDITTVLQTLEWDMVRWYDPLDAEDHWKYYTSFRPSGFNDFTEMNRTMGIWVNVTVGGDHFVDAGRVHKTTAIQLLKGWNLVSYASFINRRVDDALSDIWSNIEKVEGFDGSNAPYYLKKLATSDWMEASRSYWIRVTDDCIWTVEN